MGFRMNNQLYFNFVKDVKSQLPEIITNDLQSLYIWWVSYKIQVLGRNQ